MNFKLHNRKPNNGFGLILAFLLLVLCIPRSESLNASACYGVYPECDYYSLLCPAGQIIKLGDLYAGKKSEAICNSADHCSEADLCCNNNPSDTIQFFNQKNVYDTYNNCSARQQCENVQSPWQLVAGTALTTTYVLVNYDCVDATNIMQFCPLQPQTRTGSYIEIMFDGSMTSSLPNECRCTINTVTFSQTIQLRTIDMRTHRFFRNEDQIQECSSVTVRTPSGIESCTDTTSHHTSNFVNNRINNNFIATGFPAVVSLEDLYLNDTQDAPAMVWLAVSAETSSLQISVTCHIIDGDLTSTTTTTTTSTTSTTTTTTPSTTTTPIPSTTTTTPSTTTTSPSTSTTTTTTTPTTSTTITPSTSTTITTTPSTSTTTTTPSTSTSTTTTTTPSTSTTTTTTPSTTTTTTTRATTPSTSPTTTSTSTSTTTTTQRPSTTTSTPTTQSTSPSTSTTTRSSSTSTSTRSSTSAISSSAQDAQPIFGDGVDDEQQETAVLLSIFVPIVTFVILGVAFLLWCYCKKSRSYRPTKLTNQMPNTMDVSPQMYNIYEYEYGS